MKYSILFAITLLTVKSFGQKIFNSEKEIYECQELVFYGYDYSHFRLAEVKRLTDGNIKKYIPAWIGFLNEHTNEIDLQKRLKKEKVVFNFDYTLSLVKKLNEDDLVTAMKQDLPADSIQNMISNYRTKETEGIGFVVILECFEKNKKRCTAYFTFFDIATKKVIMSDYFGANEGDGHGLSNYWGVGLNATFGKYCSDIYRKKLKASLK